MIFNETGIGGKEFTLGELDHMLHELGFVRWAWDYDHATYDFKYEINGGKDVYYLRITGEAADGQIEDGDTVLRLFEPYMGKAVFPHGIDYEAEIPQKIVSDANQKISQIQSMFTRA